METAETIEALNLLYGWLPEPPKARRYRAPNGCEIVGTLEVVRGLGCISGITPDGEPIYSGETVMWWEEQRPDTRDGKTIYLDEEGIGEWTFDQLTLIEEDPDQ